MGAYKAKLARLALVSDKCLFNDAGAGHSRCRSATGCRSCTLLVHIEPETARCVQCS